MKALVLLPFLAILLSRAHGQDSVVYPIEPAPGPKEEEAKPDLLSVAKQALAFTAIQHAFRYATEEATRNPHRRLLPGYTEAVSQLHGWSDGDPFYVNYVGHPLQGAVAGRIWIQNDPGYREAQFGRNRKYWNSRLRAAGFASVQSVQFEIGPFSEASVGAIQAFYPQQGFGDFVITPLVGLGWMVAEDAVDRLIVERLERRITNPYWRALIRSGLSPSASFANILAGSVPWRRPHRAGVVDRSARFAPAPPTKSETAIDSNWLRVAPFELAAVAYVEQPRDGGLCAGGSANVLLRVHRYMQLATDVGGCKMTSLPGSHSGDSLHYLAGIRVTSPSRWAPYVQFLAGGRKLTREQILAGSTAASSELETRVQRLAWSSNQFTMKFGAGVDLKVHPALSLRLGGIDYSHAHGDHAAERGYSSGIQFSSGVVLRMGTW